MKVICDVEANGLINPTMIWVIVCKDVDTGDKYVFRNVNVDASEQKRFTDFANRVEHWIGHNFLNYDALVINRLLGLGITPDKVLDTLIIGKMCDFNRDGHSIEDYGEEFGEPKIKFSDFTKWSQDLEDYCSRDVDIDHRVYKKYIRFINNPAYQQAIRMEHDFQWFVINALTENGFYFNRAKAEKLLDWVVKELAVLDKDIIQQFPDKLTLVREIHPKVTKHGTLSRNDFRFLKGGDLSDYNGGPFCLCTWTSFNPASHKQVIDVLTDAGWQPTDKTKTRIDDERKASQLKRLKSRGMDVAEELSSVYNKLTKSEKYGWKINDVNLGTLPNSAPSSARSLAKRILLESRRRTLTEWLELVRPDTSRIHGKFYGIGAWTQRMAHQNPNTANIPNEYDTNNNVKLLGKEMRSLWGAPKGRLLVGVDAEGIQLRIFAHYINDPEFTDALVKGKKDNKTDPHSLNQRILGSVCKSRAAAKRFIYALLLGAGIGKLSEILGCSIPEAEKALENLLVRYTGFKTFKQSVIPADAKRGYFIGLDNRAVPILGETEGSRRHLAMSGYLQNGEAVCMKYATLKFIGRLKEYDAQLVNFVHDEWQVECPNNVAVAIDIAKIMSNSLEEVGRDLKLNCPLAGSYWNDDKHDYTIGTNWYQTH